MANRQINDLLNKVYKRACSYDPLQIAKAFDYNVIYCPIGPETLGTRVTNNRRTTIILDNNLKDIEKILVPLHEIKHCLTDKGVGTPFLRRHVSGIPIIKREFEANCFAMDAMVRDNNEDLIGLTKYQICQYFGLSSYWARFI